MVAIGDPGRDRPRATTSSTSTGRDRRRRPTARRRHGDQREARDRVGLVRAADGHRAGGAAVGRPRRVCFEVLDARGHSTPDASTSTLRNEATRPCSSPPREHQDDRPAELEPAARATSCGCTSTAYSAPAATRSRRRCCAAPRREDIVDLREDLGSFMVHAVDATGGIAELPHRVRGRGAVSAAAVARPAPSRLDEARRFAALVPTRSAVTEWKLRFFGSALGYLWTLARPLLFFGVLYVVFTRGREGRRQDPALPGLPAGGDRALHVLLRGHAAARSSRLVERESLLRKVRFPRMVVPLSVVPDRALQPRHEPASPSRSSCCSTGSTPAWSWLELPVIVRSCCVLAVGMALLLSVAVRLLPRRRADLGGRQPGAVLRLADLLHGRLLRRLHGADGLHADRRRADRRCATR